jgi:prepilin-type N-terminal cleavage/methylation domain-containing protein
LKINYKGFSLIELIVVIAIFATIAATAIPYMTGWIFREDYRNASQQLLQVLQQGRSLAISQNREHQVEFDLANDDTYSYRISRGNRSSSSTVFTPVSTWEDSSIPVSVALRGTVACNSAADATFTFNPNGSATVSNYICIFDVQDMAAGRKYRVGIENPNTGRVTIE